MKFIDVFAGCGGLSLGLLKAGFTGVAAIEKNPMAFETLRHNLINGHRYSFDWPDWLPRQAMTCEEFLDNHLDEIHSLRGVIDLMVGGPPCQGFSLAGRRDPKDPRNRMAEQYLELVKIIRPKFIVIENVSGFDAKFNDIESRQSDEKFSKTSYAEYICSQLEGQGYSVSRGKINSADFGVPQNRQRYFIICSAIDSQTNFIKDLANFGQEFKSLKRLGIGKPVSASDAIADLELSGKSLIDSLDSDIPGFKQIDYQAPDILSPYLRLMREDYSGLPNSLRIPRHRTNTILQFIKIQQASTPGKSLPLEARKKLGLKKHAITVLAKDLPSPTITTLPDDIIHYSEARILTARETARIQSFPDWFEFKGKYTTGGAARKLECPRYTQIGNAVPPLLAEAIGMMLHKWLAMDISDSEALNYI
ncbi:DNA cytosine methyltransferase [Pseudomonas asiatica]|uniref:DNA cytosine methyltransferase n=1 Tax=Pseudomonas asiatica TaxID=2219225 RepID=UPI003BA37EC5|nr:DNA cytosine methyltransferase [Pseudomonas shirazica]